jgi:hypothetical protein
LLKKPEFSGMWRIRLVIINLLILISWMVVPMRASDSSLVSPSEIKSSLPADDINLALRRTAINYYEQSATLQVASHP